MNKIILNLLFLAIACCLQAQEAQFSVSVSTDSLLMGNPLEVTFTLKNTDGKHFEAPVFEGFQIVGGPNQSSSFQMVNGDVSQEMSYSYYLQPVDIGTHYIPPASIETKDGFLETQPIEVIVYPNPDGIQQDFKKPRSNFHFFDFPRGHQTPAPPNPSTKPKKKRKIYRL